MTCKDCIHSGLCYKENDYENFPDRCGSFISDKVLEERPTNELVKVIEAHEDIGFDRGFRDGYAQAVEERLIGEWKIVEEES